MQGVQLSLNLDTHMMRQHIEVVHEGNDGYIALCSRADDGAFSQRHYMLDELICSLDCLCVDDEMNYYFSVNSFYRPQRVMENVRQIRALYADIDCHHVKPSAAKQAVEDTLRYLEHVYGRGELPIPSIVVRTGRGIQLYWLIEDLPRQGMPLWKLVQDAMTERLGAALSKLNVQVDNISDASRILRLSGTNNTKARKMATLYIRSRHRSRLDALISEYFPELELVDKPRQKKAAQGGQNGRLNHLYNLYSLHYARLMDISKLLDLRKGEIAGDECRRRMVFLYRYWSCCYLNDPAQALMETLEYNKRFTKPLSERMVKAQTASAEKAYREWLSGVMVEINGQTFRKGYNYKNSTLIKWLGITEEEQQELQTIIGTDEKYIRKNEARNKRRYGKDENGLTEKQRARRERDKRILILHEQGISNREIGRQFDMNEKTVRTALKRVRLF